MTEFDEALEQLENELEEEVDEDRFKSNYFSFLAKMIDGVDKRMIEIRKKLEKQIDNPKQLAKLIEYQRATILIQAVVKGSIAYLTERKIKTDVCLSICGSDLDHITKSGEPALIGNFAFMYPESEEELEYHMNVLLTFLDAKQAGWKPGIYTTKDLAEVLEKFEKNAEEYEKYTVRGKL